jgi:uncharacterized protein (TIGR02246 family)
MAACMAEGGHMVGFDGSEAHGSDGVMEHIDPIFRDHPTPAYVTVVKDVTVLSDEVTLLRAIVGMAPPGQSDLSPGLNAIQTLVAVRQDGAWKIASLQTTPAALHGRPDAVAAMTDELRAARR